MMMLPEVNFRQVGQEDQRPSINHVPDPRIPRHRSLPTLIRTGQVDAFRAGLNAEAAEIEAELEQFPGHPRLLSAEAAVKRDLGRLGTIGALDDIAARAERGALEANARLDAASQVAAEIDKTLADKLAAADVGVKRRAELVEQLGALAVDGGGTKHLQREVEQLDGEAVVTQAGLATLRQRAAEALAARGRAADDASAAARAAESARLQARDQELRAVVIAAIDLVRGASPTKPESARMKTWFDTEMLTLLY